MSEAHRSERGFRFSLSSPSQLFGRGEHGNIVLKGQKLRDEGYNNGRYSFSIGIQGLGSAEIELRSNTPLRGLAKKLLYLAGDAELVEQVESLMQED